MLPTAKQRKPPLYQLRIFAPDRCTAKSRYWYFVTQLRRMKKTQGEIVCCKHVSNVATHEKATRLLPPANEVWGKVIFLHLFVILFTGVGWVSTSVHAGIPPPPPPLEQTPPGSRHPRPWCRACWEIRSMRGRYASYWNALFLLLKGLSPG